MQLPLLFENRFSSVPLEVREPWRKENPEDLQWGLRYYRWMSEHYEVPLILTILYVVTIFGIKKTAWNFLFCLSKIPELIDTVFIVLRKSQLRFLHWYHHIATMWYCWDSFAIQVQSGSTFAGMNLVVHSVMYNYYGMTALGHRFSNTIRKSITNIQVLQLSFQLTRPQMILGICIIVHNIVVCNDHPLNLYLGLLMYISYAYLFIKLWINEYVQGGRRGTEKKTE